MKRLLKEGAHMETTENYVYKKEVDWSLLTDGIAIPFENQVIFGRNMGKFLSRGESREIKLFLDGKIYTTKVNNLNFASKFNRTKDTLQIRYSPNGDLANALKNIFVKSYQFLVEKRSCRDPKDRSMIKLPEDFKEYLAIYTTEYEDSYVLETIVSDDIYELKKIVNNKPEYFMEADFNYDIKDSSASIFESPRVLKIRKLNRKIGDNLKLLYEYRCQICGEKIGEEYGACVAEAHHIDYFVSSLNNDAQNQLIVCPNHHCIIHDVNPVFDKKRKLYMYSNGFLEGLKINVHL